MKGLRFITRANSTVQIPIRALKLANLHISFDEGCLDSKGTKPDCRKTPPSAHPRPGLLKTWCLSQQ